MSSGGSELYALDAILKEIGPSFLIHARADSSTARVVATKKRSESQDETHSHEVLNHSRSGISETANDVIGHD